jgi:type II secretory pathway predicted ATPase ExeA
MGQTDQGYHDHPLFLPENLRLTTAALLQLNETIHRWLWTGMTGGIVSGTSRVGKTTALEMLEHKLLTRGKQYVPVCNVSMEDLDPGGKAVVYRQLCEQAGLQVPRMAKGDQLSKLYTQSLIDLAVTHNSRYVVLFVDEVQFLNIKQLNAFANIYNKLRRVPIHLMVIFVGNDEECEEIISAIERGRCRHI